MRNNNYQEQFYKRVKERHLWAWAGWILFRTSFASFTFSIVAFFLGIPFDLFYILVNISILGILWGSIFTILFSRLGWSRSKFMDFVLNRLSILLILSGMGVMAMSSLFYNKLLNWMSTGQGVVIVGAILFLLGIHFQSSIKE